MPISHICPHCGAELGHTAPAPDPIYGLPLVACTGCGRHTPRPRIRRHPLLVLSRRIRGTTLSLLLVAASAAVLLMLVAAVAASGEEVARSLDRYEIGPRSLLLEHDLPPTAADAWRAFSRWCATPSAFVGLAYLGAILGAGAYLRSALGHCHALIALAVFIAATAAVSAWSEILALIDAPFSGAALPTGEMWTRRALLPAMMAVPVVFGFPIGIPLRWLAKTARRNARLAILRHARSRRAAA